MDVSEHPVDRLVIRHFSRLLAARSGVRFRRPKKLDLSLPSRAATPKRSDYLLQDEAGNCTLVELKRWLPDTSAHGQVRYGIAKVVRNMGLPPATRLDFRSVLRTPAGMPNPEDNSTRTEVKRWREFQQLTQRSVLRSLSTGRRRGWRKGGFFSFSVLACPSSKGMISSSITIMRTSSLSGVVQGEFDRLTDHAEDKFKQSASKWPGATRVLLWLALTDTPSLLGRELQTVLSGSDGHPWPPKCHGGVDQMCVIGLDTRAPGIHWFWPRSRTEHIERFFDTSAWSIRRRARLRSHLHNYFALRWEGKLPSRTAKR